MPRKTHLALLSAAICATAQLPANAQICKKPGQCEFKNMKQAIDYTLAREADKEWKKIHWYTDSTKALADARAQGKPIFVFFVVKQTWNSPKAWVGEQADTGKT